MTTVAWDGKILSGDMMVCYGGTPLISMPKVGKTPEGVLYGASGDLYNTIPFKAWVEAGRPEEHKPTIGDAFSAIVIELDGTINYYTQKLIPSQINSKTWAIGSGCEYALGAMAAGADSAIAVDIASKWDINTGMGVLSVWRNDA